MLTLKTVRFGNYSLLKFNDLNKILTDGNLWNAFPATLSLSLPKVSSVTIDREKRYSGKSKINFFGLIFHALRVFSVLRFKILYSSIIYLGIIYLFLKDYFFLLIIFLFFFIFINISNFTLSLFNNKNLKDNFNNIKS